MTEHAGGFRSYELSGTLRFNDLEGGFWSLDLDEAHPDLGDHVILQGWSPDAPIGDGTRICARVREQQEQFGFLMAGPMVAVIELVDTGAK